MADPFSWAAIAVYVSVAAAAASTYVQVHSANVAAAQAEEQAIANAKRTDSELLRQQEDVNASALQQKADRIRQADQELGALRVSLGERGVSASTFQNFLLDFGYTEGLDLSRIEGNRKRAEETLQSQREANRLGLNDTVQNIALAASSSKSNAIAGGVSSGLQIGSSYYTDYYASQSAKNKSTNQKRTSSPTGQ